MFKDSRWTLFILLLFFLSCSKENDDNIVDESITDTVELKGFNYWLQTGESWQYEYYLPSVPISFNPHRGTLYHISRDTSIISQDDTFAAKILVQKSYYPNSSDTTSYTQEVIFYFIKNERRLMALFPNPTGFDEHLLVDFMGDRINQICGSASVVFKDTLKIVDQHFIRYILSNGIAVVEGLTLGLLNCEPFPPNFIISSYPYGDHQVTLYRYTSNEYSYEWKR